MSRLRARLFCSLLLAPIASQQPAAEPAADPVRSELECRAFQVAS